MSKKVDSSIAIQIFELCTEFYKNGKFFVNNYGDQPQNCYLIDINYIDKVKKEIKYDKLKKYVEENQSYEAFREKMKDFNKKIKIDVNPEKFKSSIDLINSLKKKRFYLSGFSLTKKLYENKDLGKFVMKCKFHKDKIIIIFDENDKVKFFNNATGLIEKELLVQDNQTDKNVLKNSNIETLNKNPTNNYSFKADLEILIRLFYYNRFLKQRENSNFGLLNEEHKQTIYSINNDWLEEYKSFYYYKELENYLLQFNQDNKISSTNDDFISKEYIDKIISNLPNEYIKNLEKNGLFNKKEKFTKYDTDKIIIAKDNQENEIPYFVNIQFINTKIYSLLINAGYEISEQPLNKCDLYFIGNQKILILYERDVRKLNDEIGFINEKNIFIPEYILNYNNNNIQLDQLNIFFKDKFDSFIWNIEKDNCHIKDKNNSNIGKCFRIKKSSNEDKTHKYNEQKKSNSNNAPLDPIEKEVQKYIELFIQIY